jgi:hypothetical protein
MDNKALWHRVCVTDPKCVKPITGKQYNGNSPKPYWIIERLTDEFGPCGIGWGFNILNERIERFSDTDTLHIAVVRLWYMLEGKRGELEQIGQTKASYTTSKGSFLLDEDAPKKSVTDALIKCASYLGFAGDIFSGRWDDSKYVAEANREWREREAGANPANDNTNPANGGPVDMSPTARARRIAVGVAAGDAVGAAIAMSEWDKPVLDAVWAALDVQTQDKLVAAWPKWNAA